MKNAGNRRRYPRRAALFSARYTAKEVTYRDLIKDIGAGGVFVTTRQKLNPGRAINIQLPIFAFGKRFSLMGTVVRCDSEGFAVKFDEPFYEKMVNEGERGPTCADDSLDSEKLKN